MESSSNLELLTSVPTILAPADVTIVTEIIVTVEVTLVIEPSMEIRENASMSNETNQVSIPI